MRLIDADALRENHSQWGGACVSVLMDIDEAPTVAAVPIEPLAQWLGMNYEPPYGNRTLLSWPIDEHEQTDIWREFLRGFMENGQGERRPSRLSSGELAQMEQGAKNGIE